MRSMVVARGRKTVADAWPVCCDSVASRRNVALALRFACYLVLGCRAQRRPGYTAGMDKTPPPLRVALVVTGLGIGFNLAGNGQVPGASVPFFVAALAALLRLTLPHEPSRDAALSIAFLLSAFVPFRASEALLTLDLVAVAGLLGFAATGGALFEETVARLADRALTLARAIFSVPRLVAAPMLKALPHVPSGKGRTLVRAVGISVPVLTIFAALLGAADPVFARMVVPDLSQIQAGPVASHAFFTGLGIVLCGALWAASAQPLPERAPRERRRLATVEWATALGALLALFAVFVGVQLTFLFAGSERVEVTPGLTYAQYARSGFFQLLAAGTLTAGLVVGFWDVARRDSHADRVLFAALVSGIVALCLVILASAAMRLALYQEAFGFTVMRLAAWFGIGAVGVMLAALAAAVWKDRRRIVVGAAIAIAAASLVAANMLNPDAFVAARNADRFAATGKIDAAYLATLGPDAAPVLLTLFERVPEPQRHMVRAGLCAMKERTEDPNGWRSWNAARDRARAALDHVSCVTVLM